MPPHPPRRSRIGLILLAIGGVLLLLVAGGGVGAAYALGWLAPEPPYTSAPQACELVDPGVQERIAPGRGLEQQDDDLFTMPTSHCLVADTAAGDGSLDFTLAAQVFTNDPDGLVRDTGQERAAEEFGINYVDRLGLVPTTDGNGVPAYTVLQEDAYGRTAHAAAHVENLIVHVTVFGGDPEDASADHEALALELLTHALEQAGPPAA